MFNVESLMQSAHVISTVGARDLAPAILDKQGRMRPVPAHVYEESTTAERALFGHKHAIYGFVTTELIDHLQQLIGGRTAIEIGAGHGGLAAALGIRATDNKMQNNAKVMAYYKAAGMPTVEYGDNVETLDAHEAVRKYQPQVVIASWVTHKYDPARHAAGGNAMGVNEEEIIAQCEDYIFIGNTETHRGKSIWTLPHHAITPDWLYSRAANEKPEFLGVWPGGKRAM